MESTPVGVILEEREIQDDNDLLQKGFQKQDLISTKEQNPLPPNRKLTLEEGHHFVQRRLRNLGLHPSTTYIDNKNGNCMFEASMDQLSTVLNIDVPRTPHFMRLQIVTSIVGQEHLYAFNFDEPLDKWIDRMSQNGCYADALMLQLISNKYNVNIRVIQVFQCDGESTITPQRETGYESAKNEIILLYYSELRFLSGHYISVKKTQSKELDLSNILGDHEISTNEVSTHELSTNELSSLHFNSYASPVIEPIDTPDTHPQSEVPQSEVPQSEEPPAKKVRMVPRKITSSGKSKRTR